MTKRQPTRLREYHAQIDATYRSTVGVGRRRLTGKRDRDVAVGAFARIQRRRRILVGLVGAVMIVAAGWLYWALTPRHGAGSPEGYSVLVRCQSCGHEEIVSIGAGQNRFPLVCSQCGQPACYKVWQCRNPECRHQFVAGGGPTEIRCPKCGGAAVGTATEMADGSATDNVEPQD